MDKIPLTDTDIYKIKNYKNYRSLNRIFTASFLIVILLITCVIVKFDSNNVFFKFMTIFIISLIFVLIILSFIDTNFNNDLREKKKIVGLSKIKTKEHRIDNEDNKEQFILIFDDWRIGEQFVTKEFWLQTEETNEFYIEVAINSGYVLKFEKDNISYIDELISQKIFKYAT